MSMKSIVITWDFIVDRWRMFLEYFCSSERKSISSHGRAEVIFTFTKRTVYLQHGVVTICHWHLIYTWCNVTALVVVTTATVVAMSCTMYSVRKSVKPATTVYKSQPIVHSNSQGRYTSTDVIGRHSLLPPHNGHRSVQETTTISGPQRFFSHRFTVIEQTAEISSNCV